MGRQIGLGFVAGVLGTWIFLDAGYALLQGGLGLIPATAPPPWAWSPVVPPLGVPRFMNLAFWGGVWGAVLAMLLPDLRGAAYWLMWTLVGAFALTLVGNFIVPVVKGQAWSNVAAAFSPRRFGIGLVLNGLWGLGTGLALRLLGRRPA